MVSDLWNGTFGVHIEYIILSLLISLGCGCPQNGSYSGKSLIVTLPAAKSRLTNHYQDYDIREQFVIPLICDPKIQILIIFSYIFLMILSCIIQWSCDSEAGMNMPNMESRCSLNDLLMNINVGIPKFL